MKCKHSHAIVFSGVLWLGIGLMLLSKGLGILQATSSITLISLGLVIGFFKGRFILKKTVKRVVDRIHSLPNPLPIAKLYSPGYMLLIGGMIALGVSMRFIPVPSEVRGTVDVAIGAALMNGAMLYFRQLLKKG